MLSRKLRPAPVARSILVTLGFTLVYITSTLTIWSGNFAFLSGQPDIPNVYDGSSALRSVAFGLTFGVIGLVGMRWHGLHRPLPVVAGLLLLTGIGLVWDPANALAGSMQTTGGMLIGIGMASLFSTWEQIFYEQPEEAVGFEIGVAAIVSGVLFLALTMLHAALAWCAIISSVACVAISWVLLRWPCDLRTAGAIPNIETLKNPGSHRSSKRYSSVMRELWKPTLCVAALGFVSEIVRASAFESQSVANLVNSLSTIGIVISGVMLIIIWALSKRAIALTTVYQVFFPIFVTGFVLMPFLGLSFRHAFVALTWVAFSVLMSLLMIICASTARQHNVSALGLYGISSCFSYLFAALGAFVGFRTNGVEAFGVAQVFIIALFSIYLLALALFASRAHREKKALEPPTSTQRPRANSEDSITESIDPAAIKSDPTDEACQLLAQRYGLSKREQDVLRLYVRGRDTPYIVEHLYITENTVRTHIRGIYRKTGVHSKQELLDTLESTDSL